MLTHAARKIHNTRSRKVVGLFPSTKMACQFKYESTLEKDAMLWMEYLRQVVAYRAQPHCFEFTDESGCQRRYTPDMEVELRGVGHRVFYEIKPLAKVKDEGFRSDHRARQRSMAAQGCELRVATERSIRRQPWLRNLQYLQQFASCDRLLPRELESVASVLADAHGALPIEQLIPRVGQHISWDELMAEVFGGGLFIDLADPIGRHSLIRMRRECDV